MYLKFDPGEKRPAQPFLKSRGMLIPKHPAITKGMVRISLKEDKYERKEAEAALKVVRRDDTVLEIGGGIGYMSTLIPTKKPIKEMHTYEANPALIPFIREMHHVNKVDNVTVHNKLLAARKTKPVDFYVRKNFLASSMDNSIDPDDIIATEQVEVENINTMLKSLKPDVLICDIEGAEEHLLPVADWSCLRAAIIELHPQWIGAEGVRAVFDCMHAAGLTYFAKASEGKVVTFKRNF